MSNEFRLLFSNEDPNFIIHDTLTINFQIQTFSNDGLLFWIGDSLPESSFTIEIQNRQVSFLHEKEKQTIEKKRNSFSNEIQLVARAVVRGEPFSVRTEFTKNRLCDGNWHCVQVRLDGSLLTMKVDKRQFSKTEPRVSSVDMRGPLFIGGYGENYSPSYLSVRTKDFFRGNLRSLRINDKEIEWLTARAIGLSTAAPGLYNYHTESGSSTRSRVFPHANLTKNTGFSVTTTTRKYV